MTNYVHVHPTAEKHDTGNQDRCWCAPRVEDHENGSIVVHNLSGIPPLTDADEIVFYEWLGAKSESAVVGKARRADACTLTCWMGERYGVQTTVGYDEDEFDRPQVYLDPTGDDGDLTHLCALPDWAERVRYVTDQVTRRGTAHPIITAGLLRELLAA